MNRIISELKDDSVEKRTILYNAFIEDALRFYLDTGKTDFESWLTLKRIEFKRLLDNARYIKDFIILKLLK